MRNAFAPVLRQNLSDTLARRIKRLIQSGGYKAGDRLPPIGAMARGFGVGHPAVREALKKLETTGVVEIRHGAGVFVARSDDVLVLASPDFVGRMSRQLLLDLVEARVPIEVQAAALAARHRGDEDVAEMQRLLDEAGRSLDDDAALNAINMAFHGQIARASGNVVIVQLLGVLQELFTNEQRLILDIFGSRERDHEQHLGLLDAVARQDERLAAERMQRHLEDVRDAVARWNPDAQPAD